MDPTTRFAIHRGEARPPVGELVFAPPEKLYFTVSDAMGQGRTKGHWLLELRPSPLSEGDWMVISARRVTR